MPRIKKLTDYTYSPTNPSSEDAIRGQIDNAIQEVYNLTYEKTAVDALLNQIINETDLNPNKDPEVTNARGVFNTLSLRLDNIDYDIEQKSDITYVNTKIASIADGSPKGVYATLSALQSAFPTGTSGIYVVTADGKWYYWSGSAWTVGGTYQSTGLADKSVDNFILADNANAINYSHNLLSLAKMTPGYFVMSGGVPTEAAGYSMSEFIRINPNTKLMLSSVLWGAFYDINKVKLGVGYTTTDVLPISVPANAYYVRCTFTTAQLPTAMVYTGEVVLPYKNFGDDSIKTDYVRTASIKNKEITLAKLNADTISFIFSKEQALLKDLKNPHKVTNIKLFGDSITHGVGATGFSQTGDLIGATGIRRDVLTSSSWANLIRTYLNDHFNKVIWKAPFHDLEATVNTDFASSSYGSIYALNTTAGTLIFNTTYKGESVKLLVRKKSDYGIFNVYVNGILIQSVDTYNITDIEEEVTISAGSADLSVNNLLEIKLTNTKNASSTGKGITIMAIGYNKFVNLENNGMTGTQSHAIWSYTESLTNDGDVIIVMPGTNDRFYFTAWRTHAAARNGIAKLKSVRPNSVVVLMSANPCGETEFSNEIYKSHMEDIDTALRFAAGEEGILFISHYSDMSRYVLDNDKTVGYFTSDHTHPNDVGHAYIADNLLEKLGLSVKMNRS